MNEEKLYELWAPFAGMPDDAAHRAAIAYVARYVTVAHDSDLHVATYEEAVQLVVSGRLKPFSEYHEIKPGQLCGIAAGWSERWMKTWSEIAGVDKQTFIEGWYACDKYRKDEQYIKDWEAAIVYNKKTNKRKARWVVWCRHCGDQVAQMWTKEGAIEIARQHHYECPNWHYGNKPEDITYFDKSHGEYAIRHHLHIKKGE